MNKHIKTMKFFEKNRSNNAIKLNGLQWELINTPSYATVRKRKDGTFGIHNSSIRRYKKSLTMKTTKTKAKSKKLVEMCARSVEAL